jgi:hypothetical protein
MFHTTLSRLAVASLIAASAMTVAAGIFSWTTDTAYAADQIACNGDHALEADGYSCSALLNKGTGTTIGEAFHVRSGATLTIYTNLFSPLPDDGHSDQKLCVDDDTDPYFTEGSCIGANAAAVINGAGLVPAPGGQEEGAGDYEFMIEGPQLTEFDGAGPATGLGGYAVNVSTYTYFSFHFNEADKSIETFFQPSDDEIEETETAEVTKTGSPNGTTTPGRTSTVVRTTTATSNTVSPTVTEETETATSTPTPTTTSTSTSTPSGNTTTTTNRRTNTPTAEVGGATTTPGASSTPVNTVLAAETTPTASAVGVSLPAAGGGGSLDAVRENLPMLLLAMWLIVLVIVGGAVVQRRGL